MKINKEKHLECVTNKLNNAIDGLERLRNEPYVSNDLLAVLDKSIEWYESDNQNAYDLFFEAFPCDNGPIDFYSGLGSFLVNTILDDSCFELVWTRFEIDMIERPAEPWCEDMTVSVKAIWSSDDSPNRSTDAATLFRAMEHLEEKDRRREAVDKYIDDINSRLKGIQNAI